MADQETITNKDGIFARTGPIPKAMLDKLVVRGRQDQVDRALRTHFSWDGVDNTAALVTSVEETTGRLLDIGWVTLGSRTIKFKASDLWSNASKELRVEVQVADLGEFVFPRGRHWAEWADSDQFQVKVFRNRGKEELTGAEMTTEGLGRFSLRLCITPFSVGGATVVVGALPLNLDTLKERYPEHDSASCPQVHLALDSSKRKSTMFYLAVEERPQEGVGIGAYPFLPYNTADVELVMPSSRDLRESVALFLRKARDYNNRTSTSVLTKLDDPTEFDREMEATRIWPPPAAEDSESERDYRG